MIAFRVVVVVVVVVAKRQCFLLQGLTSHTVLLLTISRSTQVYIAIR